MKKNKKLKLSKFEKIFYTITFLVVIAFPVVSIYAKAALSKVNYEVEEQKEEIAVQKKDNESLQMKINELASLENLEAIAKKLGLTYISKNIKTIE